MRWERVEAIHGGVCGGPGKRWGHTCNATKGGRFLYVFGGFGQDNRRTNLIHVFDSSKRTWSQPAIKGFPPTPRDNHSCTTVRDNLFVFGGTDGKNLFNDLHVLDTTYHTWITPTIRGRVPEAREGHGAALVGTRLFIFGGCGRYPYNIELYYNDLYILDTETIGWKKAVTTGTPPSPRVGHSCSSWKNNIIVVGGEDGHENTLSDVHILDTVTLMWRQLDTTGQILPPRADHSTVSYGKILFVFGGFVEAPCTYNDLHMLDVETGLWTQVAATGDQPSSRFALAGDSLDLAKTGILVFIGGCDESLEALDDIYFLHTGFERRAEKLSLWKQLKLKSQEQNRTQGTGHDKLPLMEQLKLKPQEQNWTPGHDKATVSIGATSGIFQPMPLSTYYPPGVSSFSSMSSESAAQGKKLFCAKLVGELSGGYSIETVIDGKLFQGVLISSEPSALHPSLPSSSRKRASSEIYPIAPDWNPSNKTSIPLKFSKHSADPRQAGDIRGKNYEVAAAAAALPAPKIAETYGASSTAKETKCVEVPATQEPTATPSASKSIQEGDAQKSNLEVKEESLPASSRSPMRSSPKQGPEESIMEFQGSYDLTTFC